MTVTNNVSVLTAISSLVPNDATRLFRTIERINEGEASLVSIMKEMKPHLDSLGPEVDMVPRLAKLLLITNLIKECSDQLAEKTVEEEVSENPLLNRSIDELDMTVRTTNFLKEAGIYLIKDLVKLTEDKLLKVPNLGRKLINEIKDTLKSRGLTIGMR
jgi:DNA-directed RNA polymerase alpha subunit